MDVGWIVALSTLIPVVITGIVGLLASRHKAKIDDRELAIRQLSEVNVTLQGIVSRYEGNTKEYQVALAKAQEGHAECREEVAELRGSVRFLYSLACRQNNAMAAAGLKTEAVGDLPMRSHEPLNAAATVAAAVASVAEAHSGILRQEAKRVTKIDPPVTT